MTALSRAWAVMCACLLLAGALLGGPMPRAAAEPDPGEQPVSPVEPVTPETEPVVAPEAVAPPEPNVTAPISWPQLGRSDRIDIVGSNQLVDTDVPVPEGVVPGVLTGVINSVVNVADGRVDVLDARGTTLGTIVIPPELGPVPFAVDLSAAQVTDGSAKLSFVLRDANPPGNSCTQLPSLTMSQLAVNFLGQAPFPAMVSDFEPGYTDQIVIRTGPTPSRAQQQAALDLVAKLTQHYRPMPVRVDVDTSSDPLPPGSPTRRVIELRDIAPARLLVENPNSPDAVLVISGKGDDLSRQVQLFADQRIKLAQTDSAAVTAVKSDTPKSTNIKTFGQLNMTGQTSVANTSTLYVGFDVSQFAIGPIQEAKLHLIAHYTPVLGGQASMVVRSGSTVLASKRLDESGVVDVNGVIPRESVQSNVGIAIELHYTASQECAPLSNRIQFTLDPGSTVAVTPGTHNRGGFAVLPMAFTPDFDVVVDQPDHLRFAAQAVNLMAQQTAITLRPQLNALPAAATSGRGLLVVGRGEDLSRAGLTPTVLAQTNGVGFRGTPDSDVNFNGPVGVVQVFSQNNRTILAVSATDDWSLVERNFDYIRAADSRWASLTGDVVATGAASQTVNLTVREGGPLINEYPGDGWKWWSWLTIGAIAAAVVAVAGLLIWQLRVRLRRRQRQLPTQPVHVGEVPHE
ncbi:hypothetical protein FHT44_000444 [Mycolicibacterium sp. BK634]|uniref:hypothetical protein n=2 Tax=Mycobacteriaceae TaxID=1762 RepID=UPI001612A184|nr:hypothetical protein [Mycolicibacterium sp. BK634]MBB3747983.1 hypothetical protein [Mycolicibacterium sp. BK634]